MTRYYLSPKIFGCRLVLHQFHRSDNDRHYHDHPWNFISFILKGSYIEHFPSKQSNWWQKLDPWHRDTTNPNIDIQQCHRRFSIIKRPKEWKHWVELADNSWCYECGEYLRRLKEYEKEAHREHNSYRYEYEECWTLVFLYGQRREWGFWTEKGWIKHNEYDCRGNYAGNQPTSTEKSNTNSN